MKDSQHKTEQGLAETNAQHRSATHRTAPSATIPRLAEMMRSRDDYNYAQERYATNYKNFSDAALLELPPQGPLGPPILFVCTYAATLANFHQPFQTILDKENPNRIEPRGAVLAINSNFGHVAQPGYEHLLKTKKASAPRTGPSRSHERKPQGDGTCFNSSIELAVSIEHEGVKDDKLYFIKCFTTTGETQVPGTICHDLSDGHAAVQTFVDYLNGFPVGDLEPGSTTRRLPVVAISERANMIDVKFRLNRSSPRILVNLHHLFVYLNALETTQVTARAPLAASTAAHFEGWPVVVLPPYAVRETKPPTDDVKVSFHLVVDDSGVSGQAPRQPRINVFQGGKINILGADSMKSCQLIYTFFVELFARNWEMLVCLQPRRDSERFAPVRAPVPVPVPVRVPARAQPKPRTTPLIPLTDDILDEILAEIWGTAPDENLDADADADADASTNASSSAEKIAVEPPASAWPGKEPIELQDSTPNVPDAPDAPDAPGLGTSIEASQDELFSAIVDGIVDDLGEWGFSGGESGDEEVERLAEE
jgi:hypothetical protein